MKALKTFLCEAEETNNIRSIWASKLEAKQLQDKLKSFLRHQKEKVSLGNKEELRKVFKAFVGTLTFGTQMKNLQVLKEYGMATEIGFKNVILSNQKEFEDRKWNTACIKDFDLTELQKAYKKYKESPEYIQGENVDNFDSDEVDDRDLIIYDRYNPDTAAVYSFKGKRGKSTDHQVNMIRMDFHYEFDVKYYDCYAILAKNYFGHEEELKKRAQDALMDQEIYQNI